MAQQVPRFIDLSTLRSDGTGRGPVHDYTQIPRHHADYRNYIQKKLTDEFNRNHYGNEHVAAQLTKYGPHEFIGDLPRGYTLWTHQTDKYHNDIEELYGHPSGKPFRSSRVFSGHIGEMLAAKDAREANIRADVLQDNDNMARSAIQQHNMEGYYQAQANRVYGTPLDINDLNDARNLPWLRRDADQEVLADQQSTAAVVITCACAFR